MRARNPADTAPADIGPVKVQDMTAASRPSLSLAWPRPQTTVSVAAIDPAKPRPAKRTPNAAKPASRDRKAAAIVAKEPDISGAELGRRPRVSERTGRRLLAELSAA